MNNFRYTENQELIVMLLYDYSRDCGIYLLTDYYLDE